MDKGASDKSDRAGGPADLSRCASQPSALIPSAGDDLASRTPEQLGAYMKALTKFISEWSKVVANAEENARKERELLMMAMAEALHHTHACQECGIVWRPAKINTHGVRFLPGYKNPDQPQ